MPPSQSCGYVKLLVTVALMSDCQDALDALKALGHIAFHASVEKVGVSSIFNRPKVLVVAENGIWAFPKKSGKPQSVCSYLTLEECKIDKGKIKLKFAGDVVIIETKQGDRIVEALREALGQFLTPQELEKFNIQKCEKQTNFVIYSRLTAVIEQKKVTLDAPTLELFMRTILYQQTHIVLPANNVQAVRVFLQVLPLCKFVTQVTFPEFEFDKQDIEWLKQSSHLRYISFTGRLSRDMIDYLKEAKPFTCGFNKISGMTVDDLMAFREIPCLGNEFHYVFDLTTFEYFSSDYLAARRLNLINVDHTPNLNVRAMLENAKNIVCLSIADCNLEVAYTMSDLVSLDLKKLRVVNLAGNRCNRKVSDQFDMSTPLFTVNVDRVQWGEECLAAFLSMALRSFPKGLRLSISQAEASDSEWERVFSLFSGIPRTTLASLSWNNNPVKAEFFEMLKRSEGIEYLSVNGCFGEKDSMTTLNFASYLKTVAGLRFLSARGTKDRCFGDNLFTVLNAIRACSPIEILDIQDSRCGDDGIDHMRECFLPNTTIKVLCFDGVGPKTLTKYQQLIDDLSAKPHLKVSYPEQDMALLGKHQDVSELKAKLVLDAGSDLQKPFHVFKFTEELPFPREIDPVFLERLLSDTPGALRPMRRSVYELCHLNVIGPIVPERRPMPEPRSTRPRDADEEIPKRNEPEAVTERRPTDLKATPRKSRLQSSETDKQHSLLLDKTDEEMRDSTSTRPRSNTMEIYVPTKADSVNQDTVEFTLSHSRDDSDPKPQEKTPNSARQPPIRMTVPHVKPQRESMGTSHKAEGKGRPPVPQLPRDRLGAAKQSKEVVEVKKKPAQAKASSARRGSKEEQEQAARSLRKPVPRRSNENDRTRSRDDSDIEREVDEKPKKIRRKQPGSARAEVEEEEPVPKKATRKKALSVRPAPRGEDGGATSKRSGVRQATPTRNAPVKSRKISQEGSRTVPRPRRKTSDSDEKNEQKQKQNARKLPPKPPAKILWKMPKMIDIAFDQRVWVQRAQPYSVGVIFNEIKFEDDDGADESRNQTLERIDY